MELKIPAEVQVASSDIKTGTWIETEERKIKTIAGSGKEGTIILLHKGSEEQVHQWNHKEEVVKG